MVETAVSVSQNGLTSSCVLGIQLVKVMWGRGLAIGVDHALYHYSYRIQVSHAMMRIMLPLLQ